MADNSGSPVLVPVDHDPWAAPAQSYAMPSATLLRNLQWAKRAPAGGYLTQLSPDEETKFQGWVKDNRIPFDPSPSADYDMRGFYKSLQSGDGHAETGINANDGQLHFSDYFKTPYHESFSRESQWAQPNAPAWNDKDQLVTPSGQVVFDEPATVAARRTTPIAPMPALVPVDHDPFAPTLTPVDHDPFPVTLALRGETP